MFATTAAKEGRQRSFERKNRKIIGRPSTSSCSSKGSHVSRTSLSVPNFITRMVGGSKKERAPVSKLGAPFTSTPEPSDEEGSVEFRKSEFSSQEDFIGSAANGIPFALNSVDPAPLGFDAVQVVSVNPDRSPVRNKELLREISSMSDHIYEGPDMFSKECQTVKSFIRDRAKASAGAAGNVQHTYSTSLLDWNDDYTRCKKFFRFLFLLFATIGTLVNVSFWSFVVGKVYYSRSQKSTEPSFICSLVSYTDSWLYTDMYEAMECSPNAGARSFLDQVLTEAWLLVREIHSYTVSELQAKILEFLSQFHSQPQNRWWITTASASAFQFVNSIFWRIIDAEDAVIFGTVKVVMNALNFSSHSQNTAKFSNAYGNSHVDEL